MSVWMYTYWWQSFCAVFFPHSVNYRQVNEFQLNKWCYVARMFHIHDHSLGVSITSISMEFVRCKWESSMKLVRFMDNLITVFRLMFMDDMGWCCVCVCGRLRGTKMKSEQMNARKQITATQNTCLVHSREKKFFSNRRDSLSSRELVYVWCYSDLLHFAVYLFCKSANSTKNVCAMEINENWWTNTLECRSFTLNYAFARSLSPRFFVHRHSCFVSHTTIYTGEIHINECQLARNGCALQLKVFNSNGNWNFLLLIPRIIEFLKHQPKIV